MFTYNHFNFNVSDLDKSLAFYKEALGLEPVGKSIAPEDGRGGRPQYRLDCRWNRKTYTGTVSRCEPTGTVSLGSLPAFRIGIKGLLLL